MELTQEEEDRQMLVEFTFSFAHVDVYILHTYMYNMICKFSDGGNMESIWKPLWSSRNLKWPK